MADEKPAPEDDTYSDEETAKRRDATIRAMIGMGPQPHRQSSGKPKAPAVSKQAVDNSRSRK